MASSWTRIMSYFMQLYDENKDNEVLELASVVADSFGESKFTAELPMMSSNTATHMQHKP